LLRIGITEFVKSSHLCPVYRPILFEHISDKLPLLQCDFLFSLKHEKLHALWLVIVLKFNPIKNPPVLIYLSILFDSTFKGVILLREASLADRDSSPARALAEIVISFSEQALTKVGSSSVALTNEALSHFLVLICFMTSFSKSNSR